MLSSLPELPAQQLNSALTFWAGSTLRCEYAQEMVVGCWKGTEIFLPMLYEEWLESPTEFPQKELGSRSPIPNFAFNFAITGCSLNALFIIFSVVQLKKLGDIWFFPSELKPAQC